MTRTVPQRARIRARAAALAACALVAALSALAGDISRAEGGARDRVLVSTTGNHSELRRTVPIQKRSGRGRVVMSMGPELLPSLRNGDRLEASAEVETTTDCLELSARCVGQPYEYDPVVEARLVLAASPDAARGPGTLQFASIRRTCRQAPPDREHHCVTVFPGASLPIDRGQLPCAPASCYLNLVVGAYNPQAQPEQRLIIGEDEPDGTVVGDKGRLNAIRFSPGDQLAVPPQVTTTPQTTALPPGKGNRVVVFSQQLDGLQAGEQLAVGASMQTNIDYLPYNVLIRSRLILAPNSTATAPGKAVKGISEPQGEIAETNGFNCTQLAPQCLTQKVGVITMQQDAKDEAGLPMPLYVNLVVDAVPQGATPQPTDTVQVLGGEESVTRYPASLRG